MTASLSKVELGFRRLYKTLTLLLEIGDTWCVQTRGGTGSRPSRRDRTLNWKAKSLPNSGGFLKTILKLCNYNYSFLYESCFHISRGLKMQTVCRVGDVYVRARVGGRGVKR